VWRVAFLRVEVAPKGEWEEWRVCWWFRWWGCGCSVGDDTRMDGEETAEWRQRGRETCCASGEGIVRTLFKARDIVAALMVGVLSQMQSQWL